MARRAAFQSPGAMRFLRSAKKLDISGPRGQLPINERSYMTRERAANIVVSPWKNMRLCLWQQGSQALVAHVSGYPPEKQADRRICLRELEALVRDAELLNKELMKIAW